MRVQNSVCRLLCVLCVFIFGFVVCAEDIMQVYQSVYDSDISPVSSANVLKNVYNVTHTVPAAEEDYVNFSRCTLNGSSMSYIAYTGSTVKSYLVKNLDDTFTRIEFIRGRIIREKFDSSFSCIGHSSVPMELDIWGGFFSGNDYNFFVFGKKNLSHSNNAEVIRIVRYTKDWTRLDAVSIRGENTTVPFDAGCVRFAEMESKLFIHTSHQMYNGHQANLTFTLDTESMKIMFIRSGVSNLKKGYVSHSFNQFVVCDGGAVVYADHGDAYPRGITVVTATTGSIATLNKEPQYSLGSACIFKFAGSIGANFTNATLGGLEAGRDAYLVAFSSTPQKRSGEKVSNIYVSIVQKSNIKQVRRIAFSDYTETGTVTASTPYLFSVSDDVFLLMWQEFSADSGMTNVIKYTYFDGTGTLLAPIDYVFGYLSDCRPVRDGNSLVWYVTAVEYSSPVFFRFALQSGFPPAAAQSE